MVSGFFLLLLFFETIVFKNEIEKNHPPSTTQPKMFFKI